MVGQIPPPLAPAARRRRWPMLLLVGLGLAAAAVLGLWQARAPLAEWITIRVLSERGLEPLSFTVERLDFTGLRIGDLRFGPSGAVTVASVSLDYSVTGLWAGLIDQVTISGLRLPARLDERGLSLPELEPLMGDESGALHEFAAPLLPARRVILDGATVEAETPLGPAVLAASGELGRDPAGGLTMDLTLSAEAETIRLDGRLMATVRPSGAVDGTFSLRDGSLRHELVSASGLAGEVFFVATPRSLERLAADFTFTTLEAAGTAFEPGRLTFRMTEGRLGAEADLAWPNGRVALRASGDPRARPLAVRFDAHGQVNVTPFWALLPVQANGAGKVKFEAAGEVPDFLGLAELPPTTLVSWLHAVDLKGEIEFALTDLSLDGVASAASAAGRLRLASTQDATILEASEDLVLQGLVLHPDLLAQFPQAVRSPLSGPGDLILRGADRAPSTLRLAAAPAGLTVQAVIGLSLATGGVDLAGEVDTRLTLSTELRLEELEFARLAIDLGDMEAAGVNLGGKLRLTGVKGGPDAFTGALAITATAWGQPAEGLSFAGLDFDLAADLGLKEGRVTVRATEGRVRLLGMEIEDRVYLPGPVEFSFTEGRNHVEVDLDTGEVRHRFALSPFQLDGVLRRPGHEDIPFHLGVEGLSASGSLPGTQLVNLRGTDLSLPTYALAAENINGDLIWAPSVGSATLRLARLRHLAEPAVVKPVGASVNARLADDTLDFIIRIFEPLGALNLAVSGRHDLAGGRGAATITLGPLRLVPGVVELADLFPFTRGHIRGAEGTVALDGRIEWGDDQVTPDLVLTLDNFAFSTAASRFSAVTGEVVLDGLSPPTTPTGQRLTGVVAAAGLKPTPMELVFQLRPDGRLAIESAQAEFAGGRLQTKDAVFDPAGRRGELVLEVASVDLAELMALIDLEGLSSTGRLSGAIPLTIAGGQLAIRGGTLTADGPGVIRYVGSQVREALGQRDDTVALMTRALEDFRYEQLSLKIDKAYEGEGVIVIHIRGANPAVLDGHPFVFNINLSSDFNRLAGLLRQVLEAADHALKWGVEGL